MLSPSLHEEAETRVSNMRVNKKEIQGMDYARYTASAKAQVAPQIAADVVRALEVQHPPFHEPLHFEPDAGVDEAVEVAARVLEGKRIGVNESLADE